MGWPAPNRLARDIVPSADLTGACASSSMLQRNHRENALILAHQNHPSIIFTSLPPPSINDCSLADGSALLGRARKQHTCNDSAICDRMHAWADGRGLGASKHIILPILLKISRTRQWLNYGRRWSGRAATLSENSVCGCIHVQPRHRRG